MLTNSIKNLSTDESPATSTKEFSVIIVGAGQAGLSMSYCLRKKNIDHLVLEKSEQVASNWRHQRWDSFCLVTPNWQCQLPGYPYPGDDPHGFMVKEEIIAYLEAYAASFSPPIQFASPVRSLKKVDELFEVRTVSACYKACQVIIACGSYHRPFIPELAEGMTGVTHLHSSDYKNPQQLANGDVMVVGTGQSGCQIAEDLHLAGRKVHLCVGTAPRVNRCYRGKDVVDWLDEMGYYQTTLAEHPDGKAASHSTNHYVTGRDGGRDINLRIFAQQGMQLYGRLATTEHGRLTFARDLYKNLDNADEVAARINASIEEHISRHAIEAPADNNLYSDFRPSTLHELNLAQSNISTVIWATGFRMDFAWLQVPVLDAAGYPDQQRGVTKERGLYFLGLNWMHTWGSGRFYHVGRDAEYLSEIIADLAFTRSVQG